MTEEDSRERDSVALLNTQALSRLMAEHRLYIQAQDFPNWRPTVPSSGAIPGVAQNVTIIATNGLLAYFVFDDATVPVLCGHIQCFTGEVRTLFSTQKQKSHEKLENKTRRGKKKAKTSLEKARVLLDSLLPKR